jgi:predicted DCC family thiol-disulfide oxidoreductase YuxK
MHFGLSILIDFSDLSLGMIMLHLFTIDPSWIRPVKKGANDIVFYDGNCGLCHRFIRFLLAEDKDMAFRFAPLQSKTFETSLSESQRQDLPDSIVVFTQDQQVLTFSSAIIYALKRLGGFWRILGTALALIPRFLRDFGYRFIAKIRYRLYGQPKTACPMMPNHLRIRFILES